MKRLLQISILGVIFASAIMPAVVSAADVAPEPKPVLTVGEAQSAFMKAVLVSCLTALKAREPIAQLDPIMRSDLRPATDAERKATPFKNKDVPMWESLTLGDHLTVAETSATRCDVIANQLPVDKTFQAVITAAEKVMPTWHTVPQKPGYDPIVYQVEGDEDGAHYVVHLEGAEPGAPGHIYRFSLLSAWVTRTP